MKIIPMLKTIFLSVVFFGVFYILEYGFTFDSWEKIITPFLLSALTTLMVFKPSFKRRGLFLAGICFILMILAYIFNLLNFSSMVGSFGFSLLVVTIVLYLPQIFKKGHVEKF